MLRWRFQRKLASVLVFGCLTFIFASANLVFAVDGDIEVEVGILPVLTITAPSNVRIILEPGGPASVAEMPLNILTNNQTGYHASVSLDTVSDGEHDMYLRSLVNERDSSAYLEPLEDSIINIADFPVDHWGCAFADDLRYQGLNTSDKPSLNFITRNSSTSEKRYLLCAARASKYKEMGIYSNTIKATAVPNVVPDTISSITYMQEINETVIATMATNESYQLVDGRDKKIYWVTKLRDGNVFMAQNLDYDLEAKLGSSELNEWGNLYPENSETAYNESKSKLYKDGGNLYYDTTLNMYVDSNTVAFNSEKLHYHIGSFYNIEASNREVDPHGGDGTGTLYDASGLCPFSWTVPGSATTGRIFGDDFLGDLTSVYYSDAVSTLYLAPMGYIDAAGNLTDVGYRSYYLGNAKLSTGRLPGYETHLDSRRALTINSSYYGSYDIVPDTVGGFIRCVAIPGRQYIVTYLNTSNPVDLGGGEKPTFEQAVMPNQINVSGYSSTFSTNISNVTPINIPEGYTFLGWTTNENVRTRANVDETINLNTASDVIHESDNAENKAEITLYPAWEHNYAGPTILTDSYSETRTLNDITNMQDITPEIVSNTSTGAFKQLVDTRDNKKYWVRKLDDGNLWMEQNLDLSFAESRTLTPEDSNVSTSRTLVNGSDYTFQSNDGGGGLLTIDDVANLTSGSQDWRQVNGSSYSTYTILAGANSSSDLDNNGDYAESICPKGWKLPSASSVSNVFYRDNMDNTTAYTFNSKSTYATSTGANNRSSSGNVTSTTLMNVEPKYSYTTNLNADGSKAADLLSGYNERIMGTGKEAGNSSAHVISIPGASELRIDLFYDDVSSANSSRLRIFQGSYSSANYSSNNNTVDTIYLYENYEKSDHFVGTNMLSNLKYRQIVVSGDTVTFALYADSVSATGRYGYYAVVRGYSATKSSTTPLISFKNFAQSTENTTNTNMNVRCVAAKYENPNKTLQNISTMQEMTPSICAATPAGTEVQLTDTRDDQTYFVRKMNDGTCWMVQNLALGRISTSFQFPSTDTDNLDYDNYSTYFNLTASSASVYGSYVGITREPVTIEYGYRIGDINDIPINSYFRKFYSGIYYTSRAATLDNTTYPSATSICPRGWRLPSANDSPIPDENFSREELHSYMKEGTVTDYDQLIYLRDDSYLVDGSSALDLSDALYPIRCIAR